MPSNATRISNSIETGIDGVSLLGVKMSSGAYTRDKLNGVIDSPHSLGSVGTAPQYHVHPSLKRHLLRPLAGQIDVRIIVTTRESDIVFDSEHVSIKKERISNYADSGICI